MSLCYNWQPAETESKARVSSTWFSGRSAGCFPTLWVSVPGEEKRGGKGLRRLGWCHLSVYLLAPQGEVIKMRQWSAGLPGFIYLPLNSNVFPRAPGLVLQSPGTGQGLAAATACFVILAVLTVCIVKILKGGNLLSIWAWICKEK